MDVRMKEHAMRLESLDIALFYGRLDNVPWSLLDLKEHRGVIDWEDLEPAVFLKASGGIGMYYDRFKRFLYTDAAGELRRYVSFLLASLITPKDRQLAAQFPGVSIGDPFFGYEQVVAGLVQVDRTIILLQDQDDEFALSYLDPHGQTPEKRLSPYFRNMRIAKPLWRSAAIEALDEYFSVAAERLQDGTDATLQQLVSSWRVYRYLFG